MPPEPIRKFISRFSSLPSIGPRQAARLAFQLISRGKTEIKDVADAVAGLQTIGVCERCFFIHENKNGLCGICSDAGRKAGAIAIVEKETDLLSLERTGKFSGRYLVLGRLDKGGMFENSQKGRLRTLIKTIKEELDGSADEIVIAISPTTVGDLNASVIAKELRPYAKKITRLGRGLPTGGEIEFADEETLGEAIKNRE
ncbi:MAG: recombination protein RecR [Parcubacteria group bacterium]|nr:recombination protein RecR [Parcubacteria group bacterium]